MGKDNGGDARTLFSEFFGSTASELEQQHESNQNQRNKADKYFFRHTFIPSFYFVDYPDNFAESPQPPSCR